MDFILDQTDVSTEMACPLLFNVIQVAVAIERLDARDCEATNQDITCDVRLARMSPC